MRYWGNYGICNSSPLTSWCFTPVSGYFKRMLVRPGLNGIYGFKPGDSVANDGTFLLDRKNWLLTFRNFSLS